MKKRLALLTLVLCLCGCSAESELEQAMVFRNRLLSAEGCSFSARVTADYGDELYEFTMDCRGDRQGNVEFCVTAPESISGITGTMDEAGGALTFDDTALQFDLVAEDALSPVSTPWMFLKTLRSGYIVSACYEQNLLHLSVDDSYAEDALRVDIWLDENRIPLRGEILYDGLRILTLDVADFQFL